MSTSIPTDDNVVRNVRLAVALELKKKRALNQPIARFDITTGSIFLEHGDGSRTIVGCAMKNGRYSERRRCQSEKR